MCLKLWLGVVNSHTKMRPKCLQDAIGDAVKARFLTQQIPYGDYLLAGTTCSCRLAKHFQLVKQRTPGTLDCSTSQQLSCTLQLPNFPCSLFQLGLVSFGHGLILRAQRGTRKASKLWARTNSESSVPRNAVHVAATTHATVDAIVNGSNIETTLRNHFKRKDLQSSDPAWTTKDCSSKGTQTMDASRSLLILHK